ncbi:hypothetical protein CY34DRAFT_804068 [Suillus luteus UH-Slu-Lm8-n1]|uniref:Uncharacterized protein n=1 Tax=Suillus luteus UH-Slu-Lm8-n1 TaxID=930992 RepID=A0A0D0AZM2_9AGAM|nr:hypothetical protein CY34DRAFT_804068 [Suillus luteus UH-Slu-Lm8-n1]
MRFVALRCEVVDTIVDFPTSGELCASKMTLQEDDSISEYYGRCPRHKRKVSAKYRAPSVRGPENTR